MSPRQLLMMENGDEFITMDTVAHKGSVKLWKVLPDGRITPISPVTRQRVDLPPQADDVTDGGDQG